MSLSNKFNLIDEPWIPIIAGPLISLKELFTQKQHRELGGNPIQKISLFKLLLAISQAAFTPKDEDELEETVLDSFCDKCLQYLERWHDAFWLYGEKPFLQFPDLKNSDEKELGAVFPEIATGNTTLLTQIQINKSISDAEKALLIVTLMGFCLGGKKTDNKISLSKGYEKKPSSKAGPHIGHLGHLHSFAMGDSITQTLLYNLMTSQQLSDLKFYSCLGSPPWEKMPLGECCEIAKQYKNTYIGRLIPISRFCLLTENGIHYSDGINYPTVKEGGRDATMAILQAKKEAKALNVNPEKRPWRFLTSLLSFISQTNNAADYECIQLKIGINRFKKADMFSIWSGGLKVSSNAGEQYVSGSDDFIESNFQILTEWLNKEWIEKLRDEMTHLDNLSKTLFTCVSSYFKALKMDGKKQAGNASNLFWQLSEKHFQELLNSCFKTDREVKNQTKRLFNMLVEQIYNSMCPKETARQMDAWAGSYPKFFNNKNIKV